MLIEEEEGEEEVAAPETRSFAFTNMKATTTKDSIELVLDTKKVTSIPHTSNMPLYWEILTHSSIHPFIHPSIQDQKNIHIFFSSASHTVFIPYEIIKGWDLKQISNENGRYVFQSNNNNNTIEYM